jgi:hypothetical protein
VNHPPNPRYFNNILAFDPPDDDGHLREQPRPGLKSGDVPPPPGISQNEPTIADGLTVSELGKESDHARHRDVTFSRSRSNPPLSSAVRQTSMQHICSVATDASGHHINPSEKPVREY